MKSLRLPFLLLFSLGFHGCAYLHSLDSDIVKKIDDWTRNKEYHQALQTIDYIKPTHPDYKTIMRQKARIQKLAVRFENEHLSKAKRQQQHNQWHAALLTYEAGLDKLPASDKLLAAKQDFLNKRAVYLKELELRLLIHKGEWLNRNAPIHREVKVAVPDDYRSVPGIRDYEDDMEDTLPALISCTETAVDAGELRLAEQCLLLAEQLGGDTGKATRLGQIKSQINQVGQSLVREQNKKTRALLAELKQGYSLENLQRANEHLSDITKRNSRDKESLRLRRELARRVEDSLEQRMEAGRRLYSSGKIEEALQIWETLQVISPDNQKLEAHIDRARRVLAKLQRLHEEGPAITPPGQ